MSPNHLLPIDGGPLNPIAQRVMDNPALTWDGDGEAIVFAVKDELLVRQSARVASPRLAAQLAQIARNCGTLAQVLRDPQPEPGGDGRGEPRGGDDRSGEAAGESPSPAPGSRQDIEIWRLAPGRGLDGIDQARRLRLLAPDAPVAGPTGTRLVLPAVSPNHVAILAPLAGGCPAGPPHPAPPPDPERPFLHRPRPRSELRPGVTVFDSGYIEPPQAPHPWLAARVKSLEGERLDTAANPAVWLPDQPDGVYTDAAGALDGISGHGTFIVGLIAHIAVEARLTSIGLRDQEIDIDSPAVFAAEFDIAHAMIEHRDADVMQCGFAFPTLDDFPSLPFVAALQAIDPEHRRVAVVAPAGNELLTRRFWPAALPDVIGVASTNVHETGRAWFSNWGSWCDCATRGQHVYSTFVDWVGAVEGLPPAEIEHFGGWAWWEGTSFAAPKVSAAIARLVADDPALRPLDAWHLLRSGGDPRVPVTMLTDFTLHELPGVTLPVLRIR